MTAYGQSKIAFGRVALKLDRRSEQHGWSISSNLSHPGIALETDPSSTESRPCYRRIATLRSRSMCFHCEATRCVCLCKRGAQLVLALMLV